MAENSLWTIHWGGCKRASVLRVNTWMSKSLLYQGTEKSAVFTITFCIDWDDNLQLFSIIYHFAGSPKVTYSNSLFCLSNKPQRHLVIIVYDKEMQRLLAFEMEKPDIVWNFWNDASFIKFMANSFSAGKLIDYRFNSSFNDKSQIQYSIS